jgi:hypothetical protein
MLKERATHRARTSETKEYEEGSDFLRQGKLSATAAGEGGAMKMSVRITLAIVLLAAGFAAGLPIGKSIGFTTGSEWALMQAGIFAREAGVFMPVHFGEGQFRVVVKQPRGLYKRAWQLSEQNHKEGQNVSDLYTAVKNERTLQETVRLAQRAYLTQ